MFGKDKQFAVYCASQAFTLKLYFLHFIHSMKSKTPKIETFPSGYIIYIVRIHLPNNLIILWLCLWFNPTHLELLYFKGALLNGSTCWIRKWGCECARLFLFPLSVVRLIGLCSLHHVFSSVLLLNRGTCLAKITQDTIVRKANEKGTMRCNAENSTGCLWHAGVCCRKK